MYFKINFPISFYVFMYSRKFKITYVALAGVAQWIDCWPVNQGVTGPIPSSGTYLDCRPGPQVGVWKRQPHIDVSLPFFLPPLPSL